MGRDTRQSSVRSRHRAGLSVRRRGQEERAELRRDDTAQIRRKTVFRSARSQCGQDAPTVKHASEEVQLKKLMDAIHCTGRMDLRKLTRKRGTIWADGRRRPSLHCLLKLLKCESER